MTDTKRRILLQGTLAAGAVGAAVGAGLSIPRTLLAEWPKAAFEAEDTDKALTDLLGTSDHEENDRVKIKAPDIAENGAVVPVTVESDLEGIESISIVATGNRTPLVASFDLGEGAFGFASTRIKMAKTATVIALVRVGDNIWSAQKSVKVTIGGCGG